MCVAIAIPAKHNLLSSLESLKTCKDSLVPPSINKHLGDQKNTKKNLTHPFRRLQIWCSPKGLVAANFRLLFSRFLLFSRSCDWFTWIVKCWWIPNPKLDVLQIQLCLFQKTCIICQMHPHLQSNTVLHSSPNKKQHKSACSSFYEGSVFWCQQKSANYYTPISWIQGSFWFLWISQHFPWFVEPSFCRPPTAPPTLSLPPTAAKSTLGTQKAILVPGEWVHLPQVDRESSKKIKNPCGFNQIPSFKKWSLLNFGGCEFELRTLLKIELIWRDKDLDIKDCVSVFNAKQLVFSN